MAGARRLNAGVRPHRRRIHMPRIHHLAAWAKDIDIVCGFYSQHFGAEVGPLYENKAKGFASRFLSFEGGTKFEVMASTALPLESQGPGSQRLGFTHVAISLGSEQAVDALATQLREQGVPVIDGPRRTGDGYYECVVLDPEGNRVEVTA
jgi:lactoylglutathione lyase